MPWDRVRTERRGDGVSQTFSAWITTEKEKYKTDRDMLAWFERNAWTLEIGWNAAQATEGEANTKKGDQA